MRRHFHRGESYYAAVHMRVEDDWGGYCHKGEEHQRQNLEKLAKMNNLPPGQQAEQTISRWCFGADEIANITLNTGRIRGHHNILVLYAADRFTEYDSIYKRRRPDFMKPDPMQVVAIPVEAGFTLLHLNLQLCPCHGCQTYGIPNKTIMCQFGNDACRCGRPP